MRFPSTPVGLSRSARNCHSSRCRTKTPLVLPMLLEAGATESFGSNASIRADAGCRAPGTDPRADAAWTWAPAAFELDIANNDEYSASLVVNAPGS